MAKRKITVTVDEEVLALVQAQGSANLSAAVNEALVQHAERVGRRAALRAQLDRWDDELGPVSARAAADATRAFDELDEVPAAGTDVA